MATKRARRQQTNGFVLPSIKVRFDEEQRLFEEPFLCEAGPLTTAVHLIETSVIELKSGPRLAHEDAKKLVARLLVLLLPTPFSSGGLREEVEALSETTAEHFEDLTFLVRALRDRTTAREMRESLAKYLDGDRSDRALRLVRWSLDHWEKRDKDALSKNASNQLAREISVDIVEGVSLTLDPIPSARLRKDAAEHVLKEVFGNSRKLSEQHVVACVKQGLGLIPKNEKLRTHSENIRAARTRRQRR